MKGKSPKKPSDQTRKITRSTPTAAKASSSSSTSSSSSSDNPDSSIKSNTSNSAATVNTQAQVELTIEINSDTSDSESIETTSATVNESLDREPTEIEKDQIKRLMRELIDFTITLVRISRRDESLSHDNRAKESNNVPKNLQIIMAKCNFPSYFSRDRFRRHNEQEDKLFRLIYVF